MAEVAIILNNSGNDNYLQSSREFLSSPIKVDMMRLLLSTATQIGNVIKIRNQKSVGTLTNRDISLSKYISATNKTNLIVDIPLNPPIVLDGQTSFQVVLAANSQLDILFYFNQTEIGALLK